MTQTLLDVARAANVVQALRAFTALACGVWLGVWLFRFHIIREREGEATTVQTYG